MIDGLYTGVVEDRKDPLEMNRVRVRVHGVHSADKNVIATEMLPWATVMLPNTTSGVSGIGESHHFLVEGSWVILFFRDRSCQDPLIIGSISSLVSSLPNGESGFYDPSETYPRPEYLHGPDTNALARGIDIFDPELVERDFDMDPHTSIGPFETEFKSPERVFGAKYPYNHVFESESGHVREYDDTPDFERIREVHKSGTYYEVLPDGTRVQKIVMDGYSIVLGNKTVQVEGECNVSIGGNCNLYVGGDVKADIAGNKKMRIGGNYDVEVLGDHTLNVAGNVGVTTGGRKIEKVGGNYAINAGDDFSVVNGGNRADIIGGTFTTHTEEQHRITSGGLYKVTSKSNVSIEATDFSVLASSDILLSASSRRDQTSGNHGITAASLSVPPGTFE